MLKIIFITVLFIFTGLSQLPAEELFNKPFIAGCAQIFVTDDVQKNLEKYISFIHKADSHDVKILVFPEASLSGYSPVHYKEKPMPSREVLEDALRRVRNAAREIGIWVIAGTSTWSKDGIYNEVYLIDGRGEIRADYAKAQLTDGDEKYYKPGNIITTYQAGGMKFGLQICYDIRFPEPWRIQAL
ncbi:MAG: carbon-nitrogen hydrolase family protein, partial [Gemmatimonadota bacterium]|nr:carbon-nitrogen hydrolase family protein [Gemmatimonadota bacterium]